MSTFAELINRLRPTLNDATKDRHTDAKLLEYAVDGLKEAVGLRPDLFTRNTNMTTVAGVKQEPSAPFLEVVDVLGTAGGEEITFADYATFTAYNPRWRNSPTGPAEIWMRLPQDSRKQSPTQFFLWPPQLAGVLLDVAVVVFDPALTLNDAVPLTTQYEPALEAYVIFRAESEDDQHAVSGRATQFRQAFEAILGTGAVMRQGAK